MTHLDDAALDELARLAGEATPGPWWRPFADAVDDYTPRAVSGGPRPSVMGGDGNMDWDDVAQCGSAIDARFIAAANPATVAALVAEVRQLRQCLAGVRHSVQMSLAGLQDEPAFAVPLVVRGLGQTIDAIDAALDGGQ